MDTSSGDAHAHADMSVTHSTEDAGLPDQIRLCSVGIDIGSATSHLTIAELTLRRLGKAHSGRYVTTSRKVLYESPILFTPYGLDNLIDAAVLADFVRESFAAAGLAADDVDAGAVILTGEALRRENARAIASLFEDQAGRFVCATAGDLFEATMAAHGSGAVELSRHERTRVLNIDIGGGTTKLSVSDRATIESRAVIHVGSRLLAVDADNRVERLEPAARLVIHDLGLEVDVGDRIDAEVRNRISERMLDCINRFLGLAPMDALAKELSITSPLNPSQVDRVVFSSGVSEYIYRRENRDFGDLAIDIAAGVQRRLNDASWPWRLHHVSTGIRATVSGVSQYSVQVSGDTIALAGAERLPWRNLRLVHIDARHADPAEIARQMLQHDSEFGLASLQGGRAWFVQVSEDRRYETLERVARGISTGLARTAIANGPQAFLFDVDIANSIGHILLEEMGVAGDIAILDCIGNPDVDFVDIGQVIEPNNVVPVIVKTLVF
jgi:ethanolamine utilization protein EutA